MWDGAITEDLVLYLIDQGPEYALEAMKNSLSLKGLAIALTYGKDLPQGREWGTRIQRHEWVLSERSKYIRRQAAVAAVSCCVTKKELMRFYRLCRKYRGYGPLVKWVIKEWNLRHSPIGTTLHHVTLHLDICSTRSNLLNHILSRSILVRHNN